MNEACQNLLGIEQDLTTQRGQDFSIKPLNYMLDIIKNIQEKTMNFYNLEATPAERTSYRLLKQDKDKHPELITAKRLLKKTFTNYKLPYLLGVQ